MHWAFVVAGVSFSCVSSYGQNTRNGGSETYLVPPASIAKQVLAPRYKNVFLSNLGPRRKYFVNYIREENFTPIAQYAKPFYNLGGLEIDPVANRRRNITDQMAGTGEGESGIGLLLTDARTGERRIIQTPADAHVSHLKWSPDGTKLAYFASFEEATYIYVGDVGSGRSKRITPNPVLATLNTDFDWSDDGAYVFAVLLPEDRGPEPVAPSILGPQSRMSTPEENRLRTYLYLLQNPYQARLLRYYITGQFARIDVAKRIVHRIGPPAMIRHIDVSPDGKYSMVTTIDTPFSYIVPVSRFGWRQQIWNLNGDTLATLQSSTARMGIPNQNELEFKNRSDITWRPDGNGVSMIAYSKNKKGNKTSRESVYQIIQWKAPFRKRDKNVLFTSHRRIREVAYAADPRMLFIAEEVSGKDRLLAVQLDRPDTTYVIFDHDGKDIYGDPGKLVKKMGATGREVVLMTPDKKNVFLSGTRYDKNPLKHAPRPFLDRVDLRSGRKERVFESAPDVYEEVVNLLNDSGEEVVVRRETSEHFPNYWYNDLLSGSATPLSANKDYNKPITSAVRIRFRVQRPDGFRFWVTVLLPQEWDGKRLPGLIWHYPLEYDSQKAYDNANRKYNKNRFPIIENGWPERAEQILVQAGYAVVLADWPIYSERGDPNDAFVYSVQQNSSTVVDSIVARGYVDRDRIAIGGHSYGGFGTINALIHTSLFKAGIAGDANSNRILTPLGFQHEFKDLWRRRSRYLQMSPILWANRLDGALLMYSGADDQNVGTSPFMSWQLFHALNALGKPVSLYMYPYVQHHTNAKEVILDRWTRWVEWLDHYLKDKGHVIPDGPLTSPSSNLILGGSK